MNKRILALFAAFGATTIYGLNHTIAKVIMPEYIGAFGLVMLRVVGATVLFWIISFAFPNEKIDRKDLFRIGIATLFGMCINMLMFIKGLSLSTPINSSVIVTLTPIMVMILSAIFLKEKITTKKGFGILMGFGGAILLILQGSDYTSKCAQYPPREYHDVCKCNVLRNLSGAHQTNNTEIHYHHLNEMDVPWWCDPQPPLNLFRIHSGRMD